MTMRTFGLISLLLLASCAGPTKTAATVKPVEVKIIAFNDFHGNLKPPQVSIPAPGPSGDLVRVPAGGVAYFASAIDSLKAQNPYHAVVSAGDMIGATPISSQLFLDEPTILAMNMIGIDFNAAGNHEFDRGREELLRIQNGGCEKFTRIEPCQIDRPFAGAKFGILTANTLTENGGTLLPATGIKTFGTGPSAVKVGFIGLTLKDTPSLVSPGGIKGLRFADEAQTANALIPTLKAQGASAIIVLIHEGLFTQHALVDKDCSGINGRLMPILDALDPAVDIVVSGHTHAAYICDYARVNPAKPFLVTSAETRGVVVTDIDLTIDPLAKRIVAKRARNLIVQSPAYKSGRGDVPQQPAFPKFEPRPDLLALVDRYDKAARAVELRPVGTLGGPASRTKNAAGESIIGSIVADAQLAAMRDHDKGSAQIALMNADGLRADVTPDAEGRVTFGQLFALQPFSNTLVVRTLTGRQLRAVLEQQFDDPKWIRVFSISKGFRFSYDLTRSVNQRVLDMTLDGVPINDDKSYRVVVNSFLAAGGDRFTGLVQGTGEVAGPVDLDMLVDYVAGGGAKTLPLLDRITNKTPG
jgi:5'-nucleotidase